MFFPFLNQRGLHSTPFSEFLNIGPDHSFPKGPAPREKITTMAALMHSCNRAERDGRSLRLSCRIPMHGQSVVGQTQKDVNEWECLLALSLCAFLRAEKPSVTCDMTCLWAEVVGDCSILRSGNRAVLFSVRSLAELRERAWHLTWRLHKCIC